MSGTDVPVFLSFLFFPRYFSYCHTTYHLLGSITQTSMAIREQLQPKDVVSQDSYSEKAQDEILDVDAKYMPQEDPTVMEAHCQAKLRSCHQQELSSLDSL